MDNSSNKIFRIHKSGSISLKGWDKSSKIKSDALATIKDTLTNNIQAKVATSIPTPFARIHLFDTAFSVVGDNHFGQSMYHKLISEVFDVFQLIYRIGDSTRISFVEWNREVKIEELKTSANEKHVLLGEAFELFFESFYNFDKIYLIFYDGILLGGTSPLTMFYTSPNWEREMNNRGWVLKSVGDAVLFDNTPQPLHKRDLDFQEFMHKFYIAFRGELSTNYSGLAEHLRINSSNFSKHLLQKENTVWINYSKDDFLDEFVQVTLNTTGGGFIWSGTIPITKQKTENITNIITNNSEFVINSTNEFFRNYKDDKGNDIVLPTPLALVNGNHQLKYIDSVWNSKTTVPDIPYIDLHERELPASGKKKYPYITIGDFLEDAIIQMPYHINNQSFVIGYSGDFQYLLPIRKNYFNFFSVKDLEDNLEVKFLQDKIVVKLDIPIKNNKKLSFVKTYDKNNKEEVVSGKFGLGIFPFYKVIDNPEINKYSLMQIEDSMSDSEAKLNLYKMKDIVSGKSVHTVSETRVSKEEGSIIGAYSIYHQTEDNDNSFDIIEAKLNDGIYSGLIIPRFPNIKVNDTKLDDFRFAIDFGTSNTHVAYSSDRNPKIRSFDISKDDLQVVLLNKFDKDAPTLSKQYDEGFGELLEISTLRKMEFMPSIIGAGKDPDIEYPTRTVVCHGKGVDRYSKVFGNINIAYNVDDVIVRKPNDYFSNIKWGFEDNMGNDIARNRVQAYIEQTLWMIKNKIILNDGYLQPKIAYFLPLSMKKSTKEQFHDIWEETYKTTFNAKSLKDLSFVTESVVPFFELKNNKDLNFFTSQDLLNIDIGGGTSDILFFVNTEKKYYSSSFRFAANEIWGDGKPGQKSKKNGFLLMMQSYIDSGRKKVPEVLEEPFANNLNNENYSSADIISFLFKYDKYFKFSDSIKNHKYLKLILLLHYGLITYHISQLINYIGINIPMYISFTGKGSEYIKILSKREITGITKLMIEKFTGKKTSPQFEVILIDNPKEITAKGGVYRFSDKEADSINPAQVKHFGFDDDNTVAAGTNDKLEESENNQHYTYGDIISKDFEKNILSNIFKFLDIFFNDKDISKIIKKDLEINTSKEEFSAHEFLKENISLCFKELYEQVPNDELNSDIEETLFFWPFKHALFLLSQKLHELEKN